jgi:6-pyruvoyltetrahydropterin/6-carboxytetrahydropterin synthase
LHSALLTEIENAATFGKCNNPHGHGHDYVLSVTVAGSVDAPTGLLVPVGELDRLVEAEILALFSYRNMNIDVPQLADMVPTTENVALLIADLLRDHWGKYVSTNKARLCRVHVQETERNGFEVMLGAPTRNERVEAEGLLVHA